MAFTIEYAEEQLRKKDAKLAKAFRDSYDNMKFDPAIGLEEYVVSIAHNTRLWVMRLPRSWNSKAALTLAKRALYDVAKVPEISEALGSALTDLKTSLAREFQEDILKVIMDERRGTDEGDCDADGDCDAEVDLVEGSSEKGEIPPPHEGCEYPGRYSARSIRAACVAFCDATERRGLAAIMHALWDDNETVVYHDEARMLEDIVPRLLAGATVTEVYRAIIRGSFILKSVDARRFGGDRVLEVGSAE